MFWFDKGNNDVVYGDIRSATKELCDGRTLTIAPDVALDFTALPFADGQFRLVVFDPPHLYKAGPESWMAAKYGKLPSDWQEKLRRGFAECFRVLHADGVLIFKWNETQIRLQDVLALSPYKPLFGHTTMQNARTHWCTFMKPKQEAA